MSQRSHLTSHRSHKSNSIGLPNDKTQSSILQEDKYRDKDAPFIEVFLSFLFCFHLTFFSFLRELLVKLGLRRSRAPKERENKGFAPLYSYFDYFFFKNIYIPCSWAFNMPISSAPGPNIELMERVTEDGGWNHRLTGKKVQAINTGSYNYLGFAGNVGPCVEAAEEAVNKHGLAFCSSRQEYGSIALHHELETLVARFVGKPAAMVFGMGFATNSTNIPTLVGKGDLIVSDELNHSSLITGARLSGAEVKVFKHNDMKSLESVLRQSVVQGQSHKKRPWKKILIIAEGVYSMEGSVLRLPEVVALKKKYKAFLYLDEAHSIGAVGPNGRGVTDYFGVDPADVEIMMGTFTKSFGAAGGYIAATQEVINHIRGRSHSAGYASSMSPPVAMQIMSAMKIIMGEDGTDEGKKRLATFAENNKYFRRRSREMGLLVLGHDVSPIIPLMIFSPSKGCAALRELGRRKIAVVGVSFPVTPTLTQSRLRICLSAAHTIEMLDKVLEGLDYVGDFLGLKNGKRSKK
ncbi:serine palmitoyltransferase 2-like [Acropora palmata]|uniref:serine palmitoyltransferase 2-like n=1 Tax=Acropora palmata TaxID=6131 RepID=UPI003DA1C63C